MYSSLDNFIKSFWSLFFYMIYEHWTQPKLTTRGLISILQKVFFCSRVCTFGIEWIMNSTIQFTPWKICTKFPCCKETNLGHSLADYKVRPRFAAANKVNLPLDCSTKSWMHCARLQSVSKICDATPWVIWSVLNTTIMDWLPLKLLWYTKFCSYQSWMHFDISKSASKIFNCVYPRVEV